MGTMNAFEEYKKYINDENDRYNSDNAIENYVRVHKKMIEESNRQKEIERQKQAEKKALQEEKKAQLKAKQENEKAIKQLEKDVHKTIMKALNIK